MKTLELIDNLVNKAKAAGWAEDMGSHQQDVDARAELKDALAALEARVKGSTYLRDWLTLRIVAHVYECTIIWRGDQPRIAKEAVLARQALADAGILSDEAERTLRAYEKPHFVEAARHQRFGAEYSEYARQCMAREDRENAIHYQERSAEHYAEARRLMGMGAPFDPSTFILRPPVTEVSLAKKRVPEGRYSPFRPVKEEGDLA